MSGDLHNGYIWCLFSIEMNYDQPNFNLVAWWRNKPTLDQLAYLLEAHKLADLMNEGIIAIVDLWKGARVNTIRGGSVEYRLELVPEGSELG